MSKIDRVEIRDGADLTLRQLMEDNQNGKPATRAAHVGSLNGHTCGVAAMGIPTILHEPISANDGGYPTTKILMVGGEVTISDSGDIATLYAGFRTGDYRVDLSPAGMAIAQHRVAESLKNSSVTKTMAEMAQSPIRSIMESLGTISYVGKPTEVLSEPVLDLLKEARTPAQLHYLACKRTPQLGNNIRGAAEVIMEHPDISYDIISAFRDTNPEVFAEYVTSEGQRIPFKEATKDSVVYEGEGHRREVPRSCLALTTMDYLKWQRDALVDTSNNPLKKPGEGPILSGLGYVAVVTSLDLLTRAAIQDGKSVVRHVGGNEMHRYMLDQNDPESAIRRAELSELYALAHRALRGQLPEYVVMDLIPGRELNPFVYSGVTAPLGSELLKLYSEWQKLNIYKLGIAKQVRHEIQTSLEIEHPDSLTSDHMHRLLDLIVNSDQSTDEEKAEALKTKGKVDEGKAKAPEVFGKVTKILSSRENSGTDKRMTSIDNHIKHELERSVLTRNILHRRAGITLSQFDVLENGIMVPEDVLDIPFSEMSGVLKWVVNRTNVR